METQNFRLHPGDIIKWDGQPCLVTRVTESAATIAIKRPVREFTTLSGKTVRFQPKPRTAYISPDSEVEILNRQAL